MLALNSIVIYINKTPVLTRKPYDNKLCVYLKKQYYLSMRKIQKHFVFFGVKNSYHKNDSRFALVIKVFFQGINI